MLQLQRVGVSRLREPAADREGERDEDDGREPVWVRAWVVHAPACTCIPYTPQDERRRGEKFAACSSEGAHARQAGTHARTHACEYSRDTFTSLLASFARAPRAQNPMGARVKKGEREIGSWPADYINTCENFLPRNNPLRIFLFFF